MPSGDARTWGLRFEEFVVEWMAAEHDTTLYLDRSTHHDAVDEDDNVYQIKGCQRWRSCGDHRRRGVWRLWHDDHRWLRGDLDSGVGSRSEYGDAYYIVGVYDEQPADPADPRLSGVRHPVLDVALLSVEDVEEYVTGWGPSAHETKPQEQYQLRWKNIDPFVDGLDPEAHTVHIDLPTVRRHPTGYPA